MAEKGLDLPEVAAGLAAELGAGPPQVMGRELAERGPNGIVHDHTPDSFFVLDRGCGKQAGFRKWPEELAAGLLQIEPGSISAARKTNIAT